MFYALGRDIFMRQNELLKSVTNKNKCISIHCAQMSSLRSLIAFPSRCFTAVWSLKKRFPPPVSLRTIWKSIHCTWLALDDTKLTKDPKLTRFSYGWWLSSASSALPWLSSRACAPDVAFYLERLIEMRTSPGCCQETADASGEERRLCPLLVGIESDWAFPHSITHCKGNSANQCRAMGVIWE